MTEPAEVGFERHLKAVIILSVSAQYCYLLGQQRCSSR